MNGIREVSTIERGLFGPDFDGRPKAQHHRREVRKGQSFRGRNSSRDSRTRSQSRRRHSSSGSNGSFHRQGNYQSRFNSIGQVTQHVRQNYDRQVSRMVDRYIDEAENSAEVINRTKFLLRCRENGLIPQDYWVDIPTIRVTRDVQRLVDKCSFQLMQKDLEHNSNRRRQVQNDFMNTEKRLAEIMTQRDFNNLRSVVARHRSGCFESIRIKQRKEFENLRTMVLEYEKQLEKKRQPSKNARRKSSSLSESDSKDTSGDDEKLRVHRRRAESGSSRGHSDDERN